MRREDKVSEPKRALEINLISAQNLKPPCANLRRMQTYALVWVDPDHKVKTRTDRIGSENPTWNDKFFFKVGPDFLSSETSAVSIQIFAVGCLRDHLIGTVRFLTSNFLSSSRAIPTFTAVQIRRPSGRFHGVLNISAAIIDGCDFPVLGERSAIGFREQVGESGRKWGRLRRESSWSSELSCENSCAESWDLSDGGDSTTSSSSSTSNALKDWNGIRELAGNKGLRASDGAGLFCGLLMQKKFCCNPSDETHDFEWVPEQAKVIKGFD